jgi:hypothetical protein
LAIVIRARVFEVLARVKNVFGLSEQQTSLTDPDACSMPNPH